MDYGKKTSFDNAFRELLSKLSDFGINKSDSMFGGALRPGVIVITGPTATGKTALGAMLADEIGGEVVSADSMQIYKHMDIGTAKPTPEDTLGVPHYMIDIAEPWQEYSAAHYVDDATRCVDDILCRGKLPVIVGGTGHYIDSLLAGRMFSPRADEKLRRALESEYDEFGGEELLRRLSAFDPDSATKLHANDKKRIVRAIEVFNTTGITISQHDRESNVLPPRYSAAKIALTYSDRAELYKRIDKRVDMMFAAGLSEEVRFLLEMGVPMECTSMQAIGYKEMAAAISDEYGFDTAAEIIKTQSRRLAKRQLTWLRRDNSVDWLIL